MDSRPKFLRFFSVIIHDQRRKINGKIILDGKRDLSRGFSSTFCRETISIGILIEILISTLGFFDYYFDSH